MAIFMTPPMWSMIGPKRSRRPHNRISSGQLRAPVAEPPGVPSAPPMSSSSPPALPAGLGLRLLRLERLREPQKSSTWSELPSVRQKQVSRTDYGRGF